MVSSTPSVNRPVTGWVRYHGDRDWQEARFATATPVTAARFYVQNLTSGKASSIDLHRVTKMDELEWGKEGVEGLDTVEVQIGGKPSFEAMWPNAFTGQILDCLYATLDDEANAQAPDVVDLRGGDDAPPTGAPAAAWTPPAPAPGGQAPWAGGAPAGGPLATPDVATPSSTPPPPSGPPLSSIPPPGMAQAAPSSATPTPPPGAAPGGNGGPARAQGPLPAEAQAEPVGKRKGWRRRRENKMSPVVGVLAVAGCALLAVGGFIMFRGDDPQFLTPEVLSETTINQSTTVAPATTLPGETTTTSTTVVPGG